jgi:hypothetical protein
MSEMKQLPRAGDTVEVTTSNGGFIAGEFDSVDDGKFVVYTTPYGLGLEAPTPEHPPFRFPIDFWRVSDVRIARRADAGARSEEARQQEIDRLRESLRDAPPTFNAPRDWTAEQLAAARRLEEMELEPWPTDPGWQPRPESVEA